MMIYRQDRGRHLVCRFCICAFLFVVTASVYWPVKSFDFVNFDDDRYVEKIEQLERSFSLESIVWSFTHATEVTNYWVPITWLSFLVDYHLYGLEAGGYHLTNVLLHLCNSMLLFAVLLRMTGALWKSGFVAALFALHPLHVESVAWVTERKDVLSTFFWLLTLWGYVRYVQVPSVGRYLTALFFFALGLMSKPMLVTLPFVLLLLDYWPLARLRRGKAGGGIRLAWEKIPFLSLAVICSSAAFLTQRQAGVLDSLDKVSIPSRIGNALNSYVQYIIKTFWPAKLSVLYPYPGHLPLWQTFGALLCLTVITISVFKYCRRHPYLLVGWLWYIGTLVPVIGLVVIGPYAMADRYTYIPLIGFFIALTWGTASLFKECRYRRIILSLSAVIAIGTLVPVTHAQVGYWRDSISLFSHAIEVSDNNYLAYNNLGVALGEQGQVQEAIGHFKEVLRLKPDNAQAYYNLGKALKRLGRADEAISAYKEALRLAPDLIMARNNLAVALDEQGQVQEAIGHYNEVLRLEPDNAQTYYNFGKALKRLGRADEAISAYRAALRLAPGFIMAHNNLGVALGEQGKVQEAIGHFNEVLRQKPDDVVARRNLNAALEILNSN